MTATAESRSSSSSRPCSRGGPDLSCDTRFVEAGYLAACRDFLRRRFDAGTRTIEQSREQVLKFFADHESISGIQQ